MNNKSAHQTLESDMLYLHNKSTIQNAGLSLTLEKPSQI